MGEGGDAKEGEFVVLFLRGEGGEEGGEEDTLKSAMGIKEVLP